MDALSTINHYYVLYILIISEIHYISCQRHVILLTLHCALQAQCGIVCRSVGACRKYATAQNCGVLVSQDQIQNSPNCSILHRLYNFYIQIKSSIIGYKCPYLYKNPSYGHFISTCPAIQAIYIVQIDGYAVHQSSIHALLVLRCNV